MRKIPITMATQHPDNAGKPYWNSRAFISTADEVEESYICFSELGIDEYNWDWEGKFVDEAVTDRLLHKYYDYFQKNPLGKEKFLTFRLPNPRVEKQFRLGRAIMVIITSSQLAKSYGFDDPPVFETILPLTETAEEIIDIQRAFHEMVNLEHKLLQMKDSLQEIEIIPLFEQVGTIIDSSNILERYIILYEETFKKTPQYIRPYCARSDPALNSGLVPTILALKVALSGYKKLEKSSGIKLFPMLGTGSLPFRGGVSPLTIDQKIDEYKGVSTLTIQSAFRYDYPKTIVKEAIKRLEEKLPKSEAADMPRQIEDKIRTLIPFFEKPYRTSIEKIAPVINQISEQFPRRRERVQHIGLFGYSRGVGSVSLPRAIPFTGSLYTLGIPPEFIGTGRGIHEAKKQGLWDEVAPWYAHLREDLTHAGHFLCKENLTQLAARHEYWKDIAQDVQLLEEHLGVEFGPKTQDQKEHIAISKTVLKYLDTKKSVTRQITQSGVLRQSLG